MTTVPSRDARWVTLVFPLSEHADQYLLFWNICWSRWWNSPWDKGKFGFVSVVVVVLGFVFVVISPTSNKRGYSIGNLPITCGVIRLFADITVAALTIISRNFHAKLWIHIYVWAYKLSSIRFYSVRHIVRLYIFPLLHDITSFTVSKQIYKRIKIQIL